MDEVIEEERRRILCKFHAQEIATMGQPTSDSIRLPAAELRNALTELLRAGARPIRAGIGAALTRDKISGLAP